MCRAVDLSTSLGLVHWFASHRGSCLSCQASAARSQRLRRELRRLRPALESSPDGLQPAVMSEIDEPGREARSRRPLSKQRFVAAGGAVAAGITTAALLVRRRNHLIA